MRGDKLTLHRVLVYMAVYMPHCSMCIQHSKILWRFLKMEEDVQCVCCTAEIICILAGKYNSLPYNAMCNVLTAVYGNLLYYKPAKFLATIKAAERG